MDKETNKYLLNIDSTIPSFCINEEVMTPDGKGIVKRIEELYSGAIGYVCVLEKPYKVIDTYQNIIEYGFPKYSFGYMYINGLKKI